MAKPNSFELELIQKITRATLKLEAWERKHSDMCPAEDPHMPAECKCGADEHNSKISEILADLKIE